MLCDMGVKSRQDWERVKAMSEDERSVLFSVMQRYGLTGAEVDIMLRHFRRMFT